MISPLRFGLVQKLTFQFDPSIRPEEAILYTEDGAETMARNHNHVFNLGKADGFEYQGTQYYLEDEPGAKDASELYTDRPRKLFNTFIPEEIKQKYAQRAPAEPRVVLLMPSEKAAAQGLIPPLPEEEPDWGYYMDFQVNPLYGRYQAKNTSKD